MDKKTYAIGVLSIIATILFVANLSPVQPVQAATSVKDRDFTLATTRSQRGGEILYIVDNRTGQIAAISLGNNRSITPVAFDSLTALSAK